MRTDEIAELIRGKDRAYFSGLAAPMRALCPEVAVPYMEFDQTQAFFAGIGSPITQAGGRLNRSEVAQVRDFYKAFNSGWEAVVTPFSDSDAIPALLALGAELIGWESILYRSIDKLTTEHNIAPEISIFEVGPDQMEDWARFTCQAFGNFEGAENLVDLIQRAPNTKRYIAKWDQQPAATASLFIGQELTMLAGGATLPEFRGRGIQHALIQRRLADAADLAEWIVMGAQPGTASHRNAERAGFRLAYNTINWHVPA